MKFNTRDRKPHIWNIAVLAAITAALSVILILTGADRHAVPVNIMLVIFFAAAVVLLIRAFFRQLRYNPYSYNAIYYVGFALFLLSVLITHIILTIHLVCDPDMFSGQDFIQIISSLSMSADGYMLLSSPFILAVSVALCISNASLIRHEGLRFVNILGFLLSILMTGGEVLLFCVNSHVSGSERYVMIHELLSNTFAAVYLYLECMAIGTMIVTALTSGHRPEPDKDFLIIPGCAVRDDGTPSPLLRDRIDRAVAFRNDQLERTGKDLVFVTSGGRGADEVISESESMKRYLMKKGIPEDRILEEDLSTNTFENMKFSKAKIDERDPDANIAFCTTNYHVFRSGLFARMAGMRAVGTGAKAKWYFWPNALVREFIGLLTRHRIKQTIVITGLIACYTFLTLCKY